MPHRRVKSSQWPGCPRQACCRVDGRARDHPGLQGPLPAPAVAARQPGTPGGPLGLLLRLGRLVALHPRVDVLQGVEGDPAGVPASRVAVRAPSGVDHVLVEEQRRVHDVAYVERIQARVDKEPLAVVVQLRLATGLPSHVHLHGKVRDDMERPHVQPGLVGCCRVFLEVKPGVLGRAELVQVLEQALGEEHCVGVHLDGPVMIRVPPVLTYVVPARREHLRYRELRVHLLLLVDREGAGLEDRGVVAAEDAEALLLLGRHQVHLVGLRRHECEAEQ
mmetsp:Transcript_64501/g.181460  ORF Transcript_64501/g.181460 Transcript_64501/m.181460 type:complete len:277 (+) Transcript_64501:211-1041(+)